jgi:hypothetical protein
MDYLLLGNVIMDTFHTETIEHNGKSYLVEYIYDGDMGAPWEDCDGHGNVTRVSINRETGNIDKRPGQVVLYRGNSPRDYSYLYDYADALKTAKRDGWHYMGISVTPLTEDGDKLRSKSVSLWGIESCSEDYHKEVIGELLSEFDEV